MHMDNALLLSRWLTITMCFPADGQQWLMIDDSWCDETTHTISILVIFSPFILISFCCNVLRSTSTSQGIMPTSTSVLYLQSIYVDIMMGRKKRKNEAVTFKTASATWGRHYQSMWPTWCTAHAMIMQGAKMPTLSDGYDIMFVDRVCVAFPPTSSSSTVYRVIRTPENRRVPNNPRKKKTLRIIFG